jgi:hypothetical protein
MHQFHLEYSTTTMAAFKVSFAFVLLVAAVNGQAARSPADFWTTFAEGLTQDVLAWFANADVFPNPAESTSAAPPKVPCPPVGSPSQVIYIRGRPFNFPPTSDKAAAELYAELAGLGAPSAAPTPAQPAAASFDPWNEIYKIFLSLYGVSQPMPQPPAPAPAPAPAAPWYPPQSHPQPHRPTPAPPCSTTPAPCTAPGCQPEKVRIVIVNDCEEHKSSSESCSEESEEIGVIVPRTRSKHH